MGIEVIFPHIGYLLTTEDNTYSLLVLPGGAQFPALKSL